VIISTIFLITPQPNNALVLIKRNFPHTYRNINSSILCSALQLKFEQVINIINAYIPPSQIFLSSDISEILQNLNGSTILLGDLNSWSPLWGSPQKAQGVKKIESVILENTLIVFNDDSPTHLPTHNTYTTLTTHSFRYLTDISTDSRYVQLVYIR